MKPVILEMTAFGPYAQATQVDFRKLDDNLYLITGDTGAGKTTIFDGIMMALYGEASGEGDKKFRTFEMMHCDYVDKSADTVVKLTFEHMGKTHVIERTLHFQKARGTGEYGKVQTKAELREEGRDPIKNPGAVTSRVKELLGMDAGQFRKIVMLAQGEFKKFLDADSDEKNKILGKLFDNSVYVYYQELFDRARNKLEQRRREEGTERIARALEDFLWPEELGEAEREAYTAGHSRLEEALAKLVKKDEEQRISLEKESGACQEKENRMREALGRAGEQNKKLEELERKEEELKELLGKSHDMERLGRQTDRADRAFHKVRPKGQLFWQAKKLYEDTAKDIGAMEETLGSLDRERGEKKAAWERCERENQPVVTRLGIDIANIGKAIPKYTELQNKSKERDGEEEKAQKAGRQKEDAQRHKEQTEEELKRLEKSIKELDGADAKAEKLKGELDRAESNLDRLTGENGAKVQVENIYVQEGKLKEERGKLQNLVAEAGKLEQNYHQVYQAFISGQAGVLAKKLQQELRERKEAACPVCGTVFRDHDRHCFAELTEGMPEQKDVEKAKKDFERKDKEREKQAGKVGKLETALEGLKEAAVRYLTGLRSDCVTWEILSENGYLDKMIADYQEAEGRAKKAHEDALEESGKLAGLKEERSERLERLRQWEDNLNRYSQSLQEHVQNVRVLEAAIEELKRTLDYPDKETAQRQKETWESKKEELTGRIQKAKAEYDKAENDYGKIDGALQNSRKKLPDYEEEKRKAEELWTRELKRQGFASWEEADGALNQTGVRDSDMDEWIAARNAEITAYRNSLENTEKRIRDLKEETKGLAKADIGQMKEEIRRLEEEGEKIRENLNGCQRRRENHGRTLRIVREANGMLKSTESAWRRLDSLADLAAGTRNTAGGKLSFDRYVMGYIFREVLEMANERLDIMSGGRYELIHEINVKRDNAKAGLEIWVLDMTTGKRRPASSLSGGESFFVSLSLALGLSDVVQNHAGGKQLDALFIDEGFGSLDSDVLDRALSVLNQLTQGRRLVGIISHVSRLEESIPCQIRVKNSGQGSALQL